MATANEAQAVKSLNTTPGHRNRRFVFKSNAQRIEELEVDVFKSLDIVKLEPSSGSSFFLDCLIQWRELNTTEDFISLYEELMPLVQTLPLVLVHKDMIMSSLLSRLQMRARLSLDAILRLIAELSRDLQQDYIPFLSKIVESYMALLRAGADQEPEIVEQIFMSWSYIMMYLQRHLIKNVVYVLVLLGACLVVQQHHQHACVIFVKLMLQNGMMYLEIIQLQCGWESKTPLQGYIYCRCKVAGEFFSNHAYYADG